MEYFIARQQPQRLSVDFTVAVIVMHRTSEKTAAVSTVQALAPMTWTFLSALPLLDAELSCKRTVLDSRGSALKHCHLQQRDLRFFFY